MRQKRVMMALIPVYRARKRRSFIRVVFKMDPSKSRKKLIVIG